MSFILEQRIQINLVTFLLQTILSSLAKSIKIQFCYLTCLYNATKLLIRIENN